MHLLNYIRSIHIAKPSICKIAYSAILRVMKVLLTSGGITNDTLAAELEGLVGKKFPELKIGFIPTAAFQTEGDKEWLIMDLYRLKQRGAFVELVDIGQLTRGETVERLQGVDVIFFGGGNTFYLSWCLAEKDLFKPIAELVKGKVYAGISAGSMIATSTIRPASQAMKSVHLYDEAYKEFGPVGRSHTQTFDFVNFAFRPHYGSAQFRGVNDEKLQEFADKTRVKIYAADDQSALKILDDSVQFVGEGITKVFVPSEITVKGNDNEY